MNDMSNNMNAMPNNNKNEQCDKSARMIYNLIDNLTACCIVLSDGKPNLGLLLV